ncbi:MAG: membrane integrity-associated transporter subunit PqiC [Alphaproteobacteria bacterium]
MNHLINAAMTLGFVGLLLAGCGSLSPRPDPSRFFTLSSLPLVEETVAQNSASDGKTFLGIGPIKFPGYLDRQEIVVRSGQNRFEVSENDRWAEPLDENFARVLAQNLSALLRTDRIVSFPWPADRKPSYQVEIDVLCFEANSARDAQLFARWSILDGGTKKITAVKESRALRQAKEKSTEGSVAALSDALGDFSREIADAVRVIDGRVK